MDANHGGEDPANEKEKSDRAEIQQGDALVVRGEQPRTDAVAVGGVQIMLARQFVVWRWRRIAHDLSLSRGRRNPGTLRGNRLRLQRLDIGGESENLLLSQLSLERGHQRLIPGHNFRIRLQKRFAKIRFVRSDGRTICQENLRAKQAVERGSAAGAIGDMTSDAGLFGIELFARND